MVNETGRPQGRRDPLDLPVRRHGQGVGVDLAFHVAREAAPKARLVYNDYMSQEVGNEKHRYGVLKLLEDFRTRGTPVDALGVQSHIEAENADTFTGFGKPQEKAWTAFLNDVTGMGYDRLVTEFDVHDKGLPLRLQVARDAAVAAYAKAYLDQMLSYRQTKEVLAWGMVDKYSLAAELWLREDKRPKRRPCTTTTIGQSPCAKRWRRRSGRRRRGNLDPAKTADAPRQESGDPSGVGRWTAARNHELSLGPRFRGDER
ncbi:endo-1,4-beta-xylanase [Caulobacter segnis]